jgi:hypothetical protein
MKGRVLRVLETVACLIVIVASFGGAPRGWAQDRFSKWSEPVNLGPEINTASNDQHPALSPDGLSLYFVSDREGNVDGSLAGTFDIWVSHRASADSPWEVPQNLGPTVNSIYTEYAPNLSFDGHWLFFGSDRPGGCGSRDVWASHRKDKKVNFGHGGWETPVNLGCTLNSSEFDDGPTFFEDPRTNILTMYFTSQNRPGGQGDFDIWESTERPDESWGTPVNVAALNSPFRDTRTAIRHDGLEIFLTSNRPGSILNGGVPSLDLWVSARDSTSDPWGVPVNLGPVVNSSSNDGAPALSRDGTELYFYSNRPGGFGANDLYVVTRTKLDTCDRRR